MLSAQAVVRHTIDLLTIVYKSKGRKVSNFSLGVQQKKFARNGIRDISFKMEIFYVSAV